MEKRLTTESVVLSTVHQNQGLIKFKKPSSTDTCLKSGGIVPSIAGIHQLFETVKSVIKSFQGVFSDVADLALKIRVQRVAFENGCKNLLITAAKSRRDVDNIIEDPGHPFWKDEIAHRNIDTMMARFHHSCLAALEHFQENLGGLRTELHALRIRRTNKDTERCQFCLERSSIPAIGTTENFPKILRKLRDYNDIFCTLILLAVPRRSGQQFGSLVGRQSVYPPPIQAAPTPHHHYDCMQRAAQDLYDIFSNVWKFREHEAHSMNIALNLDHVKNGAIAQGDDFRFDVAVTSPSFGRPYRLIVDTAHDELCIHQTTAEDRSLKETHSRNRVIGPAAGTRISDLSELDADTSVHRVGSQEAETFICAESLKCRLSDLGLEEDLYHWLKDPSITIEPKHELECSYIRLVQTRSGRQFSFSFVVEDAYQKQGSHSLDDVLVRANIQCRRIPVEDRLRTALSLAAGILHLSTDSWLRQTWTSKDIYFFDRDADERCTLGKPFLQIENNNIGRGRLYQTKSPAATRSSLLSLGLVLIELAFSAPWHKLQLEDTLTEDLFEWEKNFLDMKRLSNTVSRELGSRYSKVVQICLFHGLETKDTDGLEKAELDEIICEDIVRELDRCLSAVTFQPGM